MFVCKIRTITFLHLIRPLFPSFKQHYCLPILYVLIENIVSSVVFFFMR